jgi:hypothetical protein
MKQLAMGTIRNRQLCISHSKRSGCGAKRVYFKVCLIQLTSLESQYFGSCLVAAELRE